MSTHPVVTVVGGGMAGSEAAWQLALRGIGVRLHEMRPGRSTPVHKSEYLAEMVCSNSLRSDGLDNAVGLLHEEMRRLGSLFMAAADRNRVPAGKALAVDRWKFAQDMTASLEAASSVEIIREEVREIPEGPTIIATGPLTSEALSKSIERFAGSEDLYFYDAPDRSTNAWSNTSWPRPNSTCGSTTATAPDRLMSRRSDEPTV